MNPFIVHAERGFASDTFLADTERFWIRRSRILILVDGRLSVVPEPAPRIAQEFVTSSSAFGISLAIQQLRTFACGFSSFVVTVATRDGDGSPIAGHDITGFRFSAEALAGFDQVWMFGIWPDNGAMGDQAIEDPARNPLSEAELNALARWMDSGGGVFAAGDHYVLGATMCHKVPRVSLMRRWTVAEDVPTRLLNTRHETTRPRTIEQRLGQATIDYPEEEDLLPQSIEWVPFEWSSMVPIARPHPLLCHPKLGPIDVLPDHMHEGRCYDFDDPAWLGDKRDRRFDFAGYANDHFPAVEGNRPLPKVVAWGTTLAAPPLQFDAGDQPHRRFPQIAAYDGQAIGIGRVVTDSTWHHWFDLNLKGIIDFAAQSANRTAMDKILRYWVNVGIYLASPDWRSGMLLGWLKTEQFNYFGRQAISIADPTPQLGRAALTFLYPAIGPCWVSQIVNEYLSADGFAPIMREVIGHGPKGRHALRVDAVEEAVVGEVIRAAYSDMDELRRQIARKGSIEGSPLAARLYEDATQAAKRGLLDALETQRRDLRAATDQLQAFDQMIEKAALRPTAR